MAFDYKYKLTKEEYTVIRIWNTGRRDSISLGNPEWSEYIRDVDLGVEVEPEYTPEELIQKEHNLKVSEYYKLLVDFTARLLIKTIKILIQKNVLSKNDYPSELKQKFERIEQLKNELNIGD